jgi:hypothetical protein
MTYHGRVIVQAEETRERLPERFTQGNRDADQCLQRAFENERIRRARSPTWIVNRFGRCVSFR